VTGTALTVHVHQIPFLYAGRGGYPSVLVASGTLDVLGMAGRVERQLWVSGDSLRIHQAALAADLPISGFSDAGARFRHTWIEPVTYAFEYLAAVCLLAGLVAVIGLVLYLEASLPARRRAWVLLRRMDMPPRQHRWLVLAQTVIPVAYGVVVGFGLAALSALGTRSEMNVRPDQPPGTLLQPPVGTLVAIMVAVGLVVVLAAGTAHARTVRADSSEVLRGVD